MMTEKIRTLLAKMNALEEELATNLREQQSKMFFQIDGKRVEFERTVHAEHRKLKSSLFHWLVTYRPQNLLTGPIIYGMAIPLLLVRKMLGNHQRYAGFLEFGDALDYEKKLEEYRLALGKPD